MREILGPVDCIVVEFPDSEITGEGFQILMGFVRQGIIRVLDLAFVAKGEDGSVSRVALKDLRYGGAVDVTIWDGASSGMLDASEIELMGQSIEPGSIGGILLYENAWAAQLVDALVRNRSRLLRWDRVDAYDLVAALEKAQKT
jgi:hypothetical protein